MMTRNFLVRAGLLAAILLAASPLGVYAQKDSTVPLIANIYDPVTDEQNTTDYYHNGKTFCSGDVFLTDYSRFTGDSAKPGPSGAYNFTGPWTPYSSGFTSTQYVHNADPGPAGSLRVQFNSSSKILTLDTRGTALNGVSGSPPRALKVDFRTSCPTCAVPGDANVFGGSPVKAPMLLNVTLDFPYTSMGVCSSRACPEAQPTFAKLWFTDPKDSSVTWRVDWTYLRVLRMSPNTWYFLADSCDGGQVAGLSKLEGKRTQPKTVFNGYYLIPFFLEAKLK